MVHAFLQGQNQTHEEDVRSLVKTRVSSQDRKSTFKKAMTFINGEYLAAQEKLDLELLRCGFYKLLKEKELYETQDKLDQLAMDMGLAEATIFACQTEIAVQIEKIAEFTKELNEETARCDATRAILEEKVRIAE